MSSVGDSTAQEVTTVVFVGREHELGVITQARALAVEMRQRQLVVVTGAAGIGKTWLCDQAVRAAAEAGWAVAVGRCWPHGGAPPLWPWPVILTELAGREAVALEPTALGATDRERFAVFRAVADALLHLGRPIFVVLDDAHYAEPAALLLLRFMAGALERTSAVLIIARRPDPPADEQAAAMLDQLERESTLVPLHPFDLCEASQFLAEHAPGGVSTDVVRALHRATGGSPMFLARAAAFGLAAAGAGDIGQAVADAFARLPVQARRTLAVAAVLGTGCAVSEVAALSDLTPGTVVAHLRSAQDMVEIRVTEIVFMHELFQRAALAQLSAAEALDLHAKAASVVAPLGPVGRVARHALAAASRSDADAERAVDACRRAAAAARRGVDHEAAADLLTSAAEIAAHRSDTRAHATVLVELAEAVLASGRLVAARPAFRHAADAAETAGDPQIVARAVLGLSGVWVHELRNRGERERVLARQRLALAALPETAVGLRARIRVRLAAEAVYDGGAVDEVIAALDEARAAADDRVLAEALSLTHHALLAPEHLERRLALADEIVATASAAGDDVLALFGLLWRTVDLYEIGDQAAERAVGQLRERTNALAISTVGYIVACIDVMRLTRAGRLSEAEQAAIACLRQGTDVGDADATGYFGAQLAVIRWLQGRDAELADLVTTTAGSASLAVSEHAFQIMVATVLARGGRVDEAAATLGATLVGGIDRLPRSSTWTTAMAVTIEAAYLLGDADLAGAAASLLEPFADHPVMPSLGVTCLGVGLRALGLAAMARGQADAAVGFLERAVAGNTRIRHRPAAALSRADLAEALVVRGEPGDHERATMLLHTAAEAAAALEMPQRVRQWTARAQQILSVTHAAVLVRRDSGWSLQVGHVEHQLPDLVGFTHLAILLARPGQDIGVVEMIGSEQVSEQAAIDPIALRAYRLRLAELDEDLRESEADADIGRVEVLRDERAAILTELRTTVGLAGRVRGFASPQERARTAIRKAISRALDAIAARDARLGAELRAAVSTGSTCRFEPTPGLMSWRVSRR